MSQKKIVNESDLSVDSANSSVTDVRSEQNSSYRLRKRSLNRRESNSDSRVKPSINLNKKSKFPRNAPSKDKALKSAPYSHEGTSSNDIKTSNKRKRIGSRHSQRKIAASQRSLSKQNMESEEESSSTTLSDDDTTRNSTEIRNSNVELMLEFANEDPLGESDQNEYSSSISETETLHSTDSTGINTKQKKRATLLDPKDNQVEEKWDDLVSNVVGRSKMDSPLIKLPAEIFIHNVLTHLPLKCLINCSRACKVLRAYSQACASYAHPIRKHLFLPLSFNILSFDSWEKHVYNDEAIRKSWYRLLSKKKKSIPSCHHSEVKLFVSSLLAEYLRRGAVKDRSALNIDEARKNGQSECFSKDPKLQNSQDSKKTQTPMPHLTSTVYRSLSVILGMYDRRPTLPSGEADRSIDLEVPNNYKWFCRCIVSPEYFTLNDQLLPSIIRSLFWIQKEKFSKKRTVAQVESLFLNLPQLLVNMPEELIQGFVKSVSDEARLMRDKIQEQFFVDVSNIGDFNAENDGTGLPRMRNIDGHQAMDASNEPGDNIRNGTGNNGNAQNNIQLLPPVLSPEQARRALEPIRLAVLVCASTATYFPSCFNAQTLATIIRNTFNLIAWGVPRAEIKYTIFNLCFRILDSIDGEAASTKRSSSKRSSQDSSVIANESRNIIANTSENRSITTADRPFTEPYSDEPAVRERLDISSERVGLVDDQSQGSRRQEAPRRVETLANHDNESKKIKGPEKLVILVNILNGWIPQIEWEMARETLIDIRDIFNSHLRRLEKGSG